MTALLMLALCIALLAALLWLIFGSRTPQIDPAAAALQIQKLLPSHYRHFPQIRPVLRTDDDRFMTRRAPRHIMNQWRAERRQVLRLYIQGLAMDFRGLQQLARLISTLSPQVKRKQELEWLWLGVRFHLLYRATLLAMAIRRSEPQQLARLTELVTNLSAGLEQWIESLTEALPQVRASATT